MNELVELKNPIAELQEKDLSALVHHRGEPLSISWRGKMGLNECVWITIL
jgi:hypothetical protein